MGSGHFVVAMFERLVALRLAEEKLDEATAVAAVISDNLFGLEIDPRCTQIAAFNLALAAWRRVGHCKLPAMNLACSGLAPNTRVADWLEMAGDNPRLKFGMQTLYRLFEKAPVLGSLINPNTAAGAGFSFEFHELQPLLEKALAQETKDDTAHEMAVTARGLAKAAEILASQFTLVATNVPYLGRGKQDEVLMEFCERAHPEAKADLATCFIERSLTLCGANGSVALVTPQKWVSQNYYTDIRSSLLEADEVNILVRMGTNAFQTPMWDFNTTLVQITKRRASNTHLFSGYDLTDFPDAAAKSCALAECPQLLTNQHDQLGNPDAVIVLGETAKGTRIGEIADCIQGLSPSDRGRLVRLFWEFPNQQSGWEFLQGSDATTAFANGRHQVMAFDFFRQNTRELGGAMRGDRAFGKAGISISKMSVLPVTFYSGKPFDGNAHALVPHQQADLAALWAFCSSSEFSVAVRKVDPKLDVTNASIEKVPFDLARWQKVAEEKYPHGLPKPFSSDPTQWLFNGHPAGADQPLHVAVARLLGYQWPRQTGSSFTDCPALEPDGLEALADADGIVCLSATKGEAPAAERLRALLAQALGKLDLPALIASAGPGGKKGSKSETLEDWLRDEFFEQHCSLFDQRPFIWHIWDGHKNGFSALVNYHQLTHASLEKLTYAYLGDWIRRQQASVDAGESGSDARLQAAKQLQTRLKLILEGEPPYDLFVRWKPLSKQAIGWHPDLNDGVRMNIRPFMATDIPGGKKGAGLLRTKPNIKWEKDRGKEPQRDKVEFPWFWKGSTFTGDRMNDVHLTKEQKEATR
jgi:hypothetical protein